MSATAPFGTTVTLAPPSATQTEEMNRLIQSMPSIYVNVFHVAGQQGGIVKLSLGETVDQIHASFRGSFAMGLESAKALVALITMSVAQMETQGPSPEKPGQT